MPGRGRPRLTLEVYEARLASYCARHAVTATREGLPPFPTGQRETPQHREWISLYKAHSRLARRARGICERCHQSAEPGSVFCEEHRAAAPAPATASGSPDERRRLLKAQSGRCPICAESVDVSDAVHQDRVTGKPRALLHARCSRLVSVAEAAGPATIDRLRAYLRPPSTKTVRR